MPVLFTYLLKLSVSLAVVFLFYQLVLRKLTFYNWNRWYLFIYTIACLFIPFIDINPVLHRNQWNEITIVQWIPAINDTSKVNNGDSVTFNYWTLSILLLLSGIIFMLCRLLIQFISFRRMMKKAEFISGNELKVYQVNDSIIPFSFGNSVFLNRNLHTPEELHEIIRHEFVHAKQKHSFDIVWGELLCIINWYNPFAWLLKRSIRQNLEFIADNKVIENGIDKKEYQYLLLKVIGNSQFSIATQFNFSSLKKRIAMMNKTKSAKRQLLRMLFLLPATAVLLLAFRNKMEVNKYTSEFQKVYQQVEARTAITRDTVPEVTKPNEKGFYIDIKDNKGNCTVVVKDKNRKEVKRLLLTEWNEKAEYYENLYGEIPAVPAQAVQPTQLPQNAQPAQVVQPAQPAQPAQPSKNKKNSTVAYFNIDDDKVTVKLNDGKTEVYDLKNENEKKQFLEKYDMPVLTQNISTNVNLNTMITPTMATTLKNSIVSDINPVIVNSTLNTTVSPAVVLNANLVTPVKTMAVASLKNPEINVSNSPSLIGTTIAGPGQINASDADILFTITKNTKPEELESLISKMKEKGYELRFTNKDYNDGILKEIRGTIKYKNNNSDFSATDFSKITIAGYRDGDNVRFKIAIDIKKRVKT